MPGAKPRRGGNAISQSAGETTMVLETRRGTYFTLDEVGAYVWNLLDGTKDLDQVVDAVCEAYDVAPETARSDIRELLDELAGERLLDGWPDG